MATNESELKSEVRVFTGYDTAILESTDLDTVVSRAKRHIRSHKGITNNNFDWFASVHREEALFWWSCLFAKVVTGELDSQDIQVGAMDVSSLLAKDDEEVTTWYRKASKALRQIDTGGDYPHGVGISAPIREDRTYEGDDTGDTGLGDL